jgi:hypothetical protein
VGRRSLLIVVVLVLAGCGGDDDKAVREDPKTVGTTTAEKPAPESTGATTAPRESTDQVTSVKVEGSRATAKLGGGQTVLLRRAGKRWQIVSFRP